MTFLHPYLLMGLAAVVLPVVIHLLMRQKPKRTPFPAMRLLRQSQANVARRLNLQHWFLMLLRMLVVAAFVFALARPTLPAASYRLTTAEWLRLAAILALTGGVYAAVEYQIRRLRSRKPVNSLSDDAGDLRSPGASPFSVAGAASAEAKITRLRRGIVPVLAIAGVLATLLLLVWPYSNRIEAEWAKPSAKLNADLPVAAVFIFDTSPSMDYRQQGKTRLQTAQAMATTYWNKSPSGSRLAVIDGMFPTKSTFIADRTTSIQRIAKLETRYEERVLEEAVRSALSLQENDRQRLVESEGGATDRYVREIYLFTDLAKHQWSGAADAGLLSELEKLKDVAIYIMDVGELNPLNTSLTALKLSRETVSEGGEVVIEATVQVASATSLATPTTGNPAEVVKGSEKNADTLEAASPDVTSGDSNSASFELVLGDAQGNGLKRMGLESAPRGSRQTIRFTASNLPPGPLAGYLRLVGDDPLAFDNALPFALATAKPPRVLVVSAARSESRLLMEALAPSELARVGRTNSVPDWIPAASLRVTDLSKYDVIFLLNLPQPSIEDWKALRRFVENGGGVLLACGSPSRAVLNSPTAVDPTKYDTPDAIALLPARLKGSLTFRPGQVWEFPNLSHPFIAPLQSFGVLEEWAAQVVSRYWSVDPADDSLVLARYLDDRKSPAVLERRVGKGIIQQWTTSWSLPDWNDLPRSWAYVALADASVEYLSQQQSRRLNFVMGDSIQLTLPAETPFPAQWLVRTPDQRQQAIELESATRLLIPQSLANHPGLYLAQPKADPSAAIPLAIRVRDAESNLERMTPEAFTTVFGADRVLIHRDIETLERAVLSGRIGQEIYGVVLLLLMLCFVGEHLIANWFYAPPATQARKPTLAPTPTTQGESYAT